MARGDITMFEEALKLRTQWDAADVIKCAIVDNTSTPTAGQATPSLSDFTEVGTAGNYVAGGTSLGTWDAIVSEAAGVMTIDSATNPSWAANASNDNDAYYAIIHNETKGQALCFVDIGGPFDMSTTDLTINWNANGLIRDTIQ